jgi:hypothetical protein
MEQTLKNQPIPKKYGCNNKPHYSYNVPYQQFLLYALNIHNERENKFYKILLHIAIKSNNQLLLLDK